MIDHPTFMGWPAPIADIYARAVADLHELGQDGDEAMQFGPGHIVWADENMGDGYIQFCLEQCDGNHHWNEWLGGEPLKRVRQSLLELKTIPAEVRESV